MTARAMLLLEHDDTHDVMRWSMAAAIVLAAHGGLVASYLLLPPSHPEGAPQAPAVIIDLAPMPVAPASPADLAPGPEMVESQPPPEPPPPQVEPEVTEPLPRIETPAVVTLPLAEPKPVEEKPIEKPAEVKRPEPVIAERKPPAPRTTAAPRSENQTAAVARAPSPGSAEARSAMANWRDLVVAQLQRAKRYPGGAESRREQGVVTLSFSVDRNGRVLSRSIVRSSGHSELDQEVLAMVQRAAPFPAFPAAMTQSQIQLTAPIRFSLR